MRYSSGVGAYQLPALDETKNELTEEEEERYAALYWVNPDLILRDDAYATTWGFILVQRPELVEEGLEVQHLYPMMALEAITGGNIEVAQDMAHDVACLLADEALRLGATKSPAIRKAIGKRRACDMDADEMQEVYDVSYTVGTRDAHAAIGHAYGLHGNRFTADAIEECLRNMREDGEPLPIERQLLQWLKNHLYELAMEGMP